MFFWNHYLDQKEENNEGSDFLVSILVFLEPLLRQKLRRREYLEGGEFQSLFFWNHYLDDEFIRYQLRKHQFQSLFFWNHYLDVYGSSRLSLSIRVSILVFLEPLLRQHFACKYLKSHIFSLVYSASFSSGSAQIVCIFYSFYNNLTCFCSV